ncbi:MAG TPA: hypothetical protein VJM34_02520, partial [Novosphingobium sp.]|nr:hypothetical protein [Novosphingobium sp.]
QAILKIGSSPRSRPRILGTSFPTNVFLAKTWTAKMRGRKEEETRIMAPEMEQSLTLELQASAWQTNLQPSSLEWSMAL